MAPLPCVTVPPAPPNVQLTLPGGASLVHQDIATVAQSALAPLMPLFDVIDALVTAIGVVQAIPDALGPPPDPSGIIALLPELGEKLSKLLGLIPQASVPLTAVGLVDAVIAALEQARSQLNALVEQVERIARAVERASEIGDPELARLATCARDGVAQSVSNVGSSLGAVGGILGLLRALMGLIGGPEIPDLGSLDGLPIDQAMALLDDLVTTLRTVRGAIPLP
jgi:hypothetical protein